jgi:hypothetical protein
MGTPDRHSVHTRPHERDAAAAVLVVDRWTAPASVVTHDDHDSALAARCRFNLTVDIDEPG